MTKEFQPPPTDAMVRLVGWNPLPANPWQVATESQCQSLFNRLKTEGIIGKDATFQVEYSDLPGFIPGSDGRLPYTVSYTAVVDNGEGGTVRNNFEESLSFLYWWTQAHPKMNFVMEQGYIKMKVGTLSDQP